MNKLPLNLVFIGNIRDGKDGRKIKAIELDFYEENLIRNAKVFGE